MFKRRTLAGFRSVLEVVPVVYSKFLSDSLRERIEELASKPVDEQFDLRQEFALVRQTALDAAILYDAASALPRENPRSDIERIKAGKRLRAVLRDVFDLAEKMVRIAYAPNRAQVSITNIGLVLDQVATVAYDVFGEEPEMIDKITLLSQRLREVRLPREDEGTTLTPDADVLEMDASVPSQPQDQSLKLA